MQDQLIEHADRCWEAERENADRVFSRRRSVATAIVVVLGLGLYKIEWYRDAEASPVLAEGWAIWTVKTLLILSIILFARALYVLFWSTTAERTASYKLAFRRADRNKPPDATIMKRTYSAYLDLRRQNAEEWDKLHRGERAAGMAVACVFLAFLLYVYCSVPPTIHGQELEDDTPSARQAEDRTHEERDAD